MSSDVAVRPTRIQPDERLVELRQAVSRLTLAALQAGATAQQILETVGVGVDQAAQIFHIRRGIGGSKV